MPTMKKRLNITLDRETEQGINILAKHKKQPKATIGADLLRKALELQEDLAWARFAEERRKSHKGRYLTHEEVWGK